MDDHGGGSASSLRERFLEAILESATDYAIIAMDLDGLVTNWNEGARRLLGWPEAEIVGRPASIFFTDEDRRQGIPQTEMQSALQLGRGTDERWHERRDGSKFWANGEMMPLKDDTGTAIGFVKILRDRTAQRLAAEARRADAEFLNGILAASGDCIKVLDLDTGLLFMNEGGRHAMEVTDFDGLRGRSWLSFWRSEDLANAEAAVETAKSGGTGHFQGIAETAAGTPKWWDVKVTPMFGADGQPEKLLAISRDITEPKLGDARRLALLELGERLLDHPAPTDISFAAAEVMGRTLGVSRAGYGTMEDAETIVIERDWTMPGMVSIAGRHRMADYGSFIDDLRTGAAVVIADTRADARTRASTAAIEALSVRALVNLPLVERGQLVAVLFIHESVPRDWTGEELGFIRGVGERTRAAIARRGAELALQDMNETLEKRVEDRTRERDRIWRVSQDMLGVADDRGVWLSVNPAWTRILGWNPEDIVGQTSLWLEHPDDQDKTRAEIARLGTGHATRAFENRFRRQDGTYAVLSWTAAPVEGLLYCVARDVTEERRQAANLVQAEEALRQSQKMEAVGQLTGGVAHDFNNLLTVIRSSVDLIKRPGLAEDRRRRYVDAIADAVDRAARLTGQLLAFARRQALRPEVFDAITSVTAIGDMVGTLTGSRIHVEVRVPDEPSFVDADPSQFDTALVNMAVNARDAMDGEGRLTISVRTVAELPPVRGHAAKAGAFVAVSINDTGSGISAEHLPRIFEPFFTTKSVGQGTGLGLSQVFGFAKQSGGEIVVESHAERGTTFTLFLPRVAGRPLAEPPAEPDRTTDGQGTRVLIVEDNLDVGTFAKQTLDELGYGTRWVTDAGEALAALATSPLGYDVIFSDVVMPGMNGVELAQEVRRLYPDLPIVLTSGYSHVLAQNPTHGFPLLQKPYSVDALSRVLRDAAHARLRGGSTARAIAES